MIPLLVSIIALLVAITTAALTVHYTRQTRRYTEQVVENYFQRAAEIQGQAAQIRKTREGQQ